MKDNSIELLIAIAMIVFVLFAGIAIGDMVGTKTFIDINYGKEFIVIEKTIKADEFSYKVTDGKNMYDFTAKDNLEMNDTIVIGAK